MKNNITDLNFCSLSIDMTDDELKECIHKMHPRCIETGKGFYLTINGYDHDPREIWEIPEVVPFFQKLIDIGFVGLLEACTADDKAMSGFGVLEVLFVANGNMLKNKGNYSIGKEEIKLAIKMYDDANPKISGILSEPCPNTGIREMEQIFGRGGEISDGAHKKRKK